MWDTKSEEKCGISHHISHIAHQALFRDSNFGSSIVGWNNQPIIQYSIIPLFPKKKPGWINPAGFFVPQWGNLGSQKFLSQFLPGQVGHFADHVVNGTTIGVSKPHGTDHLNQLLMLRLQPLGTFLAVK